MPSRTGGTRAPALPDGADGEPRALGAAVLEQLKGGKEAKAHRSGAPRPR